MNAPFFKRRNKKLTGIYYIILFVVVIYSFKISSILALIAICGGLFWLYQWRRANPKHFFPNQIIIEHKLTDPQDIYVNLFNDENINFDQDTSPTLDDSKMNSELEIINRYDTKYETIYCKYCNSESLSGRGTITHKQINLLKEPPFGANDLKIVIKTRWIFKSDYLIKCGKCGTSITNENFNRLSNKIFSN